MFDVVYLLVGVVCVEVAVMSLGLFWYLPRAISRAFVDAEEMIRRQREETMDEVSEYITRLLCAENIQKLAAVAAPVLGGQLKQAAAGFIGGTRKRAAGGGLFDDILGAVVERFVGGAMSGATGGQETMGGDAGVSPPGPPLYPK